MEEVNVKVHEILANHDPEVYAEGPVYSESGYSYKQVEDMLKEAISNERAYFKPVEDKEANEDEIWDEFWGRYNTIPGTSAQTREKLKSLFIIKRK
jgi:hypothetical protein